MSDKGKARKLEDRKPVRGQSANLQSLGGGPSMVHHHNYGIPSEGYHSGGHLAYSQLMNQSLQMGPPSMARVNDLGPPIFMPSLNLGTPKPSGGGGGGNNSSPALSNSKLKPPQPNNMSTSVAFDMMPYPQGSSPLSAFHSAAPLKPVQYISHSSTSSTSHSTSLIAKPTPVCMAPHGKGAVTKVVGGQEILSQPAFTASGVLPKASSQGGMVSIGGGVSQPYVSGCYPQHGLNMPPASSGKNLLTSSHQISSTGSLVTNATGGSYASGLLNDPYSAQSPVMVPMAPPIPVTSGQPSSISAPPDTRMDRPPHPSAPHTPLSGPTPKDRLTTAEVASNIIISNPGLTGKHIAAMTNTTQQQQPPSSSSSFLPLSSYSSPISHSSLTSGGGGGGDPSGGHMPLAQQHPHQQPHLVDTGWGGYSQQQHGSDHNIFQGTHSHVSMATGPGGGVNNPTLLNHQLNGKNRLEPFHSSCAGGGGPSLPPDQALLSPPGQPNSSSSSPRPRILRGKRSLDGNWKLDGQTNSLQHSPGSSPHRSKLQRSLKNSTLPLAGLVDGSGDGSADISGEGGGSDDEGDVVPNSPSSLLNHACVKMEGGGGDVSGSPRKKPRKQHVVANDDQYATNVPDTHKRLEEGGALTADYPVNKISSSKSPPLPGAPATPSLPPAKKLEICYLSQLRKSPYVINGVYKLHHHTAHNHFRRYADIKQREMLPLSVYDLANNRSSQRRASAWKLYHFSSQLEEVETLEDDVLVVMERIQKVLETIKTTPSSLLDGGALTSTEELIQGNIDRSKRIKNHIDSTRTNMFTVLDHRSHVMEILDKYSNFKSDYSSISPSLSSSTSSSHHKSQS